MDSLRQTRGRKWLNRGVVFVVAFVLGRTVAQVGGVVEKSQGIETIRLADMQGNEPVQNQNVEMAEELPKKIAITFDDGPNANYTEKLLEGLKKRGVKATFFVLGAEVEKQPQLLQKIQEGGHQIGVHAYEHVNFGQIGDEAATAQIEKTREIIHEYTGEYVGFIRPPYGCWKKTLDKNIPMIEVVWDVDPLDWATQSADTVVQRILPKAHDGCIILLHDASASSVQAALTVIDVLQKQGYEFVTVEELLIGC